MKQCNAVTKNGVQCQNTALEGQSYCYIHSKASRFRVIAYSVTIGTVLMTVLALIGLIADLVTLFTLSTNITNSPLLNLIKPLFPIFGMIFFVVVSMIVVITSIRSVIRRQSRQKQDAITQLMEGDKDLFGFVENEMNSLLTEELS